MSAYYTGRAGSRDVTLDLDDSMVANLVVSGICYALDEAKTDAISGYICIF